MADVSPLARPTWLLADFNGMLARDLVCLSHSNTITTAAGETVVLSAGMEVTAFDLDADVLDQPDALFASGVVEASPDAARCNGSVWALRIDSDGIRWESDIMGPDRSTWPAPSLAEPRR
jgi:hypothetical protein